MNLAFSKTRTDDITHVRTPWLLGDAIPFTRPSCAPASQAKARGARDRQPGRRTGRRKRNRREEDEMHLLLPGEARGSRNAGDERPCPLRGLFFVSLQGCFGLSIHLSTPNYPAHPACAALCCTFTLVTGVAVSSPIPPASLGLAGF
ncbi:uncharacterized protein LOC104657811 isoform X2 [Rhinopithecus roxellana]|uniref:uncharacterized protein LOC104657811 isoform X2 n=1 Tax=Rhinopithecus roxellana TaxID=61622 RepID=UPI0012379C91|nr:uncharacterized protein LOC104657811 isoform X2 [Rhinopithecus roxellana]